MSRSKSAPTVLPYHAIREALVEAHRELCSIARRIRAARHTLETQCPEGVPSLPLPNASDAFTHASWDPYPRTTEGAELEGYLLDGRHYDEVAKDTSRSGRDTEIPPLSPKAMLILLNEAHQWREQIERAAKAHEQRIQEATAKWAEENSQDAMALAEAIGKGW